MADLSELVEIRKEELEGQKIKEIGLELTTGRSFSDEVYLIKLVTEAGYTLQIRYRGGCCNFDEYVIGKIKEKKLLTTPNTGTRYGPMPNELQFHDDMSRIIERCQ